MRSRSENFRRILGRVVQQDFVGRASELDRIMTQAEPANAGRGLLLLMEPSAGVSELLRQAYDRLFNQHSDVIPIYFAITPNETTAVSAAIEFLNTFVQQYIAFRRNEPVVSNAPLTLQDLQELALPADLDWIEQLIESYNRLRFSNEDKALVRFYLGAPQRIPAGRGRPLAARPAATPPRRAWPSVRHARRFATRRVLERRGRAGHRNPARLRTRRFFFRARGTATPDPRSRTRRRLRLRTTRHPASRTTRHRRGRAPRGTRSAPPACSDERSRTRSAGPTVCGQSVFHQHLSSGGTREARIAELLSRLRASLRRRTLRRSHPSSLRRSAGRDLAAPRHAPSPHSSALGSSRGRRSDLVVRSLAQTTAHDCERARRRFASPARPRVY